MATSENVPRSVTRRDVLKGAAAAGVGFWIAGSYARGDEGTPTESPSEKLNVAMVGVQNRAKANLDELVKTKLVNIVGLCDIDDNYLGEASKQFPKAKTYNDFRQMMDQRDIDAVLVACADHVHAFATLAAMKAGKHVYCEKPLTHSVQEARVVRETADRLKRVTQMGTQIHAGNNYRRVVELIQGGAIGPVKEVHVFIDKVWAPTKPEDWPHGTAPVPANLHYDLWLGPTPERPFSPVYMPANWRRWWAFGSGTLGDMGCHYMDLPYWALKLRYPTKISTEGPEVDPEACPSWLIVHYEYPERDGLPPVKMSWYDAGRKPQEWADWKLPESWKNGVMFIGEKGRLFSDYDQHKLFPEDEFAHFEPPKPTIPESLGHHREWIVACKKNDPTATTCRFDYSGALTEAVLLGDVAYRTGKPIEWDARTLTATNAPEAERFIKLRYRDRWTL